MPASDPIPPQPPPDPPNQQQQVLQAINHSVSSTVDPVLIGGIFVGVLALAIVAAYIQKRRAGAPKTRKVLRDPKKLLKQIAGDLELSPNELRKLKHHADRLGVENPLTLMLCPSLLKKDTEQK
jgi:hypothetical protein